MRPLTLEGALKILGAGPEHRWLTLLDKALGGVILAGGVAALGAAPPVAALGAAVFALVDQKNEALGLLRSMAGRIDELVAGRRPQDRVQLITAAHTTIVVAAVGDTLRATDLIGRKALSVDGSLYDRLFRYEAPAPSAQFGFAENKTRVRLWHTEVFSGLLTEVSRAVDPVREVLDPAAARYETYFLELAAKVPDVRVWALLNDGAATREQLAAGTAALGRVETVLTAVLAGLPAPGTQAAAVARHNRAVLGREIFTESSAGLAFPRVEDGYVNPAYRVAEAGPGARPADEQWWQDRPCHPDLDVTLAGHLLTVPATQRPLVLLGHPGAGKSTLTEVLAARLPADAFTTVRVPLRDVAADAPVYDQVAQALRHATNGRVEWPRLAEDSAGTLRVLLLDGLDELLQASTGDRSGYLRQVMEFQRIEAEQQRPVAVVVTARTLVADRLDIPPGTPLVKLEPFDDDRIAQWVTIWNRYNAGTLDLAEVLSHRDLSEQPLLLLMLAVYATGSPGAALGPELSQADLYERLLTRFARREAEKTPGRDLDARIEGHLNNLSIAALGMFNRGRQDISDVDLGADLHTLTGTAAAGSGRHVVGQFFFVHTSQARETPARRQRYEFLHATFGEYLIARRVLTELADVADSAFGGRRDRDPDDDLLFALLSHSSLAVRSPVLQFLIQLAPARDDRADLVRVIDVLIAGHRHREPGGHYRSYQPVPVDQVRAVAAWSANLVLLRAAVAGAVLPAFPDARAWESTVALWRAGLPPADWHATVRSLDRRGGDIVLDLARTEGGGPYTEFHATRLISDLDAENRLRYGMGVVDQEFFHDDENWRDMMRSWILPALAGESQGFVFLPPYGVPDHQVVEITRLLERLLVCTGSDMPGSRLVYVQMLLSLAPVCDPDLDLVFATLEDSLRGGQELADVRALRDGGGSYADQVHGLRRMLGEVPTTPR
ncbi:NACHT domain-containing NTPase [Actinoplanes sp. N902-109]|uniref:NACHT domain-containing protein n=1 Tax=Actinoplanes sp. (strain N902-109) TaxID=649831 RepID=UPI0003293D3B|nr:AAA family ATPase [Actinoplanes sp. N902-109]AGL18360.1 signal transduction protein with Nacht domain [Actinoplanes sp. N902-109]